MFNSNYGGFIPKGGGSDPSLEARVTALEDAQIKSTYFQVVSAASGTITPPPQGTILLDQFADSIDALVSEINSEGYPTFQTPLDEDGNYLVTTLDENGEYILSGTPTDDVAIIYVYRIARKYFDISFSIGFEETNLFTNEDKAAIQSIANAFVNGGNSFSADNVSLGTSDDKDISFIRNGQTVFSLTNNGFLNVLHVPSYAHFSSYFLVDSDGDETAHVNIFAGGGIVLRTGAGNSMTFTSQGEFTINSIGDNDILLNPDFIEAGTGRVLISRRTARYTGNFSADMHDRSLIDREYADSRYVQLSGEHFTLTGTGATFTVPVQASGYKSSDGSDGVSDIFTSQDGKTVTVKNGIITGVEA
jgi:hypothetical protein